MNFRICISLFLVCCLLSPVMAQRDKNKQKEVTVKAMTYNTYSGRKQGIDKIAGHCFTSGNRKKYRD